MINNFIKIYFRLIKRNSTTYFINIFGLACGIAATLLLLLYLDYETNYDKFHKDSGRTYRLLSKINTGQKVLNVGLSTFSAGNYLNENHPAIESFCRFTPCMDRDKFQSGEKKIYSYVIAADTNFFSFFDFPLLAGKAADVLTDSKNIILSETIKEKFFGDEDAIGKSIIYGKKTMIVSGVMKDMPENSQINVDILIPLKSIVNFDDSLRQRGLSFLSYIKLKEENNTEATQKELIDLINARFSEDNKDSERALRAGLQPMLDVHLKSDRLDYNFLNHKRGSYTYILIFFVMAGFVLIIAIINFVNLSTAYAEKRSKEIGMRKVLGSPKNSLRIQYLAESILTAFLGFLIALGMVYVLLPLFGRLMERHLVFGWDELVSNIMYFLALVLSIGILAGLYPAFVVSNFSVIRGLRGDVSNPNRKSYLQRILVVFQFGIASFLIVCLTVIYLQLQYLQSKDLGFEKEQVIVFDKFTGTMMESYKDIVSEIKALSFVKDVAASGSYPGNMKDINEIHAEKGNEESGFLFHQNWVCEDFLKTYQIKLLEGREFDAFDTKEKSRMKAVVNQTFAKAAGYPNHIVGEKFDFYGDMIEVIGLIHDYNFESLHSSVAPMMMFYTPYPQVISVRLYPGNHQNAVADINQILLNFDGNYLPSNLSLNKHIAGFYREESKRNILIFLAAILGIVISVMGLFALTTFTMQQKRREIGIRKTLGASSLQLTFQLIIQLLIWVMASNIWAFPLAYIVMGNWLSNFAFQIDFSPWIFVFASSITLVVAVLTILGQTIYAVRLNPVLAIKAE